MRIFPILTAIIAVIILFLLVFQRDALREFAGFEAPPAEEIAVEAAAPEGQTEPEDKPGVSVIARETTAREIDSAVVLRGRTEAARSVALMAETGGRVISQPIPKGTEIDAGDVLCEIDMGTREAILAQARAALAEAETDLNNAESLSEQGFAAETRVIGARATLEAAKASVAAAERDIANTRITAPFAGVLESDSAELGSLLQAGALCATLLDLDPIRLVGFVAEADVERIEIGALAGARLSSGREVTGRVTFVSRSSDETTRTFRVEAELPNPGLSIRDGQTAEILIRSAGQMAHLLPQSALTLDDDGTLGVRIAAAEEGGDVARFVPVELLRDSRDGVWITGLPERARVIVVGQDYVQDGVALDVTLEEPGS